MSNLVSSTSNDNNTPQTLSESTALQPVKAAEFWDRTFTRELLSATQTSSDKDTNEWLLHVTSTFFDISTILSRLPPRFSVPLNILEIGCGASGLGEVVFKHYNSDLTATAVTKVTCIDISPVAISTLNVRKSELLVPEDSRYEKGLIYEGERQENYFIFFIASPVVVVVVVAVEDG